MNRIQLYKLLRKNTNLSYRRSPAFEQNKWAKAMIYLGGAMFAIYLIMYGAIIGSVAKGEAGIMVALAIVYLAIDYLLRFIFQTTPGMMVKPYILQPISRYTAIECFLLGEHVSGYNLLWLAMFIPYSIINLIAGAGWMTLVELITGELLIILNSQIYLFFRTLINRNVLWFPVSLVVYALPYTPLLVNFKSSTFASMLETYQTIGVSWYFLPALILVIVGLFFVNRWFQFRFVYEEISKKKEHALKHVSEFKFLEHFGLVGEYMKIEMKSNMRNKTMRSRCIMSLALIVVFSALIAYTNLYDGELMLNGAHQDYGTGGQLYRPTDDAPGKHHRPAEGEVLVLQSGACHPVCHHAACCVCRKVLYTDALCLYVAHSRIPALYHLPVGGVQQADDSLAVEDDGQG